MKPNDLFWSTTHFQLYSVLEKLIVPIVNPSEPAGWLAAAAAI